MPFFGTMGISSLFGLFTLFSLSSKAVRGEEKSWMWKTEFTVLFNMSLHVLLWCSTNDQGGGSVLQVHQGLWDITKTDIWKRVTCL